MSTTPVKMSDIQVPKRSEINEGKIRSLENSPDSIESLLHSKTDPIGLHKGTPPYKVYSGRHRVYVAAQKGIKALPNLQCLVYSRNSQKPDLAKV